MEDQAQQPERRCATCLRPLYGANPRQRFCGPPCKAEGWRRVHQQDGDRVIIRRRVPAAPPPAILRDCPHCGKPVAVVALLTTPQAAQPDTPPNPR